MKTLAPSITAASGRARGTQAHALDLLALQQGLEESALLDREFERTSRVMGLSGTHGGSRVIPRQWVPEASGTHQ